MAHTLGDGYEIETGETVSGVDLDSVHCDICHKIVDAKEDTDGSPGALGYKVMRPFRNSAFPQIFLGTLDDVVGRDTYSPLYEKSVYSAPCHNWIEENVVPVYTEYMEWKESAWAREGVECQTCHMKPSGAMTNLTPHSNAGQHRVGIERNPMTIPTHDMPGVNDSTFLASSVDMQMDSDVRNGMLHVEVCIANVYAGHHVPTGTPDRNMILLMEAEAGGLPLVLTQGPRLPDYAGVGDDPTDYAGRPGKGFTKLMVDTLGNELMVGWWRNPAKIYKDTRIPSRTIDTTSYAVTLNNDSKIVIVSAKLWYRKTYKTWADVKKWDDQDMLMAAVERKIQSQRIRELSD